MQTMKKCPYCAEDIQEQATVCKHCKRDLNPENSAPTISVNPDYHRRKVDNKKLLKVIGIIVLVLLSRSFWYITIPGVAVWYIWKKTKFSEKIKMIITAILIIICASLWGTTIWAGRAPTVTITEPQNNYSAQAKTIKVRGKINPANSVVTVNGNPVPVDNDGALNYDTPLPEEQNTITVMATNNNKSATATLSISRVFTEEEKQELAKQKAQAEAKRQADLAIQAKALADAKAKAEAEQAAYEKTKAGQICKRHPGWNKEECQGVADKKLWIGMKYEMLVEEWGKPNSINPSNYGGVTQYQYCWYDLRPSCFYDNDGDGLIEAFN